MRISRYAVKHPVYITISLIALIIFGVFSVTGLNIEFIGKMNLPQAFVIAIYPGADAETVEREVIDIFEEEFVTLPNFSSMTSSAYNSMGMVQITFSDGTDVYEQLNEVRNRIRKLESSLPKGLQGEPQALVGGISMLPILSFSIEVGDDLAAATERIKDEVIPQISQLKGVSSLSVSGGSENRVLIKLDTEELLSKNISVLNVYQVLSYSNNNLPLGSGEYQNKRTSISYEGSFSSIDEIKNLTVGAIQRGELIKLEDVATIVLERGEPTTLVKNDGKNIIYVSVCKREDGNTLSIINRVKSILQRAEIDSNGSMKFNIIQDDSRTIYASLNSVISSGVLGIIIAIIIILLCLGDIRATFAIALSMPLSIFFTFIGLKIFNISISLLSLSGIVIALGSIVDGSIVMLEQTYMYYKQKKDDKFVNSLDESIFKASDTVALSIVGSALTTIIVFIPIILLDGLVGQMLRDLSISFVLALGFSAIVAIVVIPYLIKKFVKEESRERGENRTSKLINKLNKVYGRAVNWTLSNRKFIIIISIVILIFTLWAVLQLGVTFIPSTDNSEFYVNFTFPSSDSFEKNEEKLDYAERIIRSTVPEIKTLVVNVGEKDGSANDFEDSRSIRVILKPVKERKRSVHEIMREVKYKLDETMTDTDVEVLNGGFDNLVSYITGGGGYAITLVSEDAELLYQEACRIKDFLAKDPEVMTVSMNTSYDNYSAIIKASGEYLSSLGITSYEAGMSAAILFNGVDSGTFVDSNNLRYKIRLESNVKDDMLTEDMLNELSIISSDGRKINYSSLADLTIKSSINRINHDNRANIITISCSTTSENVKEIVNNLSSYLEENPLKEGVKEQIAGIEKLVNDMMGPILSALVIAIFLVFMVMVFQFERFDQPLLILITIPFSIIGVALSLLVCGSTLNMISLLGIISLSGTAVNNGIILTDYMNMLVKRYREDELLGTNTISYDKEIINLRRAIVDASISRLRSILMTTLTTMLGVLPMAIGTGEGSEIYAPLGQVICGGLLATTAISLFLMPVLYFILERSKIKRGYKKEEV